MYEVQENFGMGYEVFIAIFEGTLCMSSHVLLNLEVNVNEQCKSCLPKLEQLLEISVSFSSTEQS